MPDHEIRFVCQTHGDHGVLEVVPRVEGVLLTRLVETFEADAGMQPTGDAYGGLIPRFFRFGPMEDHFHGRSTTASGPKTPVLGCACVEWGCPADC